MTTEEFAQVMLYLETGTGIELPKRRLEVYFDLLGDLDFDTFFAAARRVMLDHVWSTFPSAAELRQAAAQVQAHGSHVLSPAECWEQAWTAAKLIDIDIGGPYRVRVGDHWREWPSQADYVLSRVPKPIRRMMKAFGLRELVYSEDPVGVVRGQFLRIAEQVLETSQAQAALPAGLRSDMDAIAARQRQQQEVAGVLAGIGTPVEPQPALSE